MICQTTSGVNCPNCQNPSPQLLRPDPDGISAHSKRLDAVAQWTQRHLHRFPGSHMKLGVGLSDLNVRILPPVERRRPPTAVCRELHRGTITFGPEDDRPKDFKRPRVLADCFEVERDFVMRQSTDGE